MSFGWSGQILRVDLSKKESSTEPVAPYTSFVGGRGINVKILYDEVDPGISPFDPENRLVFGPGVLTGTSAPTASRTTVTTMGPNGIMGSPGIGGYIGAEIRLAGYDNIIIQGKSDNPVYLYIHDDVVEFRDAAQVWGKGTLETEQIIREETGDPNVQVISIGPAGENLVSFACIRTGIFSAAGRGGMGAVMGSKNLKAIAVRGRRGVEIARLEEFLELSCETRKMLLDSSETFNRLLESSAIKSPSGKMSRLAIDINLSLNDRGVAAFGNWEDDDWDEINAGSFVYGGDEFVREHYIGRVGCSGCPRACFKVCDDPETGLGVVKCWAVNFTMKVWNRDYQVMTSAAHLCNNYGLDGVSTTNIIAFLMELYHRGIITEKDTDGIPMRRGDKEAIISAVHKIARQEGFGKLFRDGVLDAARTIGRGAEEYAMQVKGLEMANREFRGRKGTALAGAVAPKSGGNEYPLAESAWSVGVNKEYAVYPGTYDNKALLVWEEVNKYKVMDMLGICKGPWCTHSLEIPARLFSLATGIDTSVDELLTAAQRVAVLERAFDVTRGIRRIDDTLPDRMFETAVPGGPLKGEKLEREKFDKMLDEYYAVSGWDDDGVPKEETFQKYGLSSEWQVFNKRIKKGR
jgi:aldehyde:ferredoxin oxidoreductase